MLSHDKRSIALIVAVLLVLAFIIGIPAVCPGFPVPVVTKIEINGVSSNSGNANDFSVVSQITNKGTAGNVVIRTRLLNASRDSVEAETRAVIYMRANEQRSFTTRVSTPSGGGGPYQVAIVAERRSPLSGS